MKARLIKEKNLKVPEMRKDGFKRDLKPVRLGDLCKITMSNDNSIYPYVTHPNTFNFEGSAICISDIGNNVGYMYLADGEFNVIQGTYILTDFIIDRNIIYDAIKSILNAIIQRETGNCYIPYTSIDTLKNLEFLILPTFEDPDEMRHFIEMHQDIIEDITITVTN